MSGRPDRYWPRPLLDVRQLPDLRERLDELPRDREIHVICRSGQRACCATRLRLPEGFRTRNISRGMLSHSTLVARLTAARWDARRDELLRVAILAGRVYRGRVAADGGLVPVRTYLGSGAVGAIPSGPASSDPSRRRRMSEKFAIRCSTAGTRSKPPV